MTECIFVTFEVYRTSLIAKFSEWLFEDRERMWRDGPGRLDLWTERLLGKYHFISRKGLMYDVSCTKYVLESNNSIDFSVSNLHLYFSLEDMIAVGNSEICFKPLQSKKFVNRFSLKNFCQPMIFKNFFSVILFWIYLSLFCKQMSSLSMLLILFVKI